jgi:apolipoprotein N-acyltransferase
MNEGAMRFHHTINTLTTFRGPLVLSIISGLLLVASFPKIDQGWLAWFALVPFLLALRKADALAGFWLGFAFGLIHYLGLIYWTAYTMQVYGHLPATLAVVVLFLLAGVLASFTGLFAMTVSRVCRKPWQLVILAPAAWVALEWVRSWIFTGFPWALLGYSQYQYLWIVQIADLFGVYGVSALIVAVNTGFALAVLHWVEKPWQERMVARTAVARAGTILALVLLLTVGYGVYRIRAMDNLVGRAPGARVAVVQGNIDQSIKWDASFQMLTTVKYRTMSLEAVKAGAIDLVIWPETAVPFYLFQEPVLTGMVLQGVKEADTHFIIGSPYVENSGDHPAYYNSAYLVTPEGENAGRYDKVHLVPYGEYVPLKRYLPFLGKMVAQVADFKPGKPGSALVWDEHPLGMLICYEIIFPRLARAMTRNGGELLVNITNDAWFGRTSAAYQHFSMAVLRSVENRRFLVRSANTGISGFIDPSGRIMATSGLYEDVTLASEVKFIDQLSLYTRWGDWPLMIVAFGLLGGTVASAGRWNSD